MSATNEAVLMIEPPPARLSAGMPYLQPRNTPLALTSSVRSQTASSVEMASSSLACMMPALLKSTCSLPNCFSAAAIICSQSGAFDTSAFTAMAFFRSFAVSRAAASFTSTATTAAPSAENSNAGSRPIPAPAPVMRATLSLRRIRFFRASDSFKIASTFPIGDRAIERGHFRPEEVTVMLDDCAAEGFLRELAIREELGGLRQRMRYMAQVLRGVRIAYERFRRLDLIRESIEPRGQGGGKSQIRIAVGARDAALDAHRRPVADDAETGSAVVIAPGEARRRPRGVDVALVGIDGRRVENHELWHMRHPAAEEPAERIVAFCKGVLAVAPQAEMDVTA